MKLIYIVITSLLCTFSMLNNTFAIWLGEKKIPGSDYIIRYEIGKISIFKNWVLEREFINSNFDWKNLSQLILQWSTISWSTRNYLQFNEPWNIKPLWWTSHDSTSFNVWYYNNTKDFYVQWFYVNQNNNTKCVSVWSNPPWWDHNLWTSYYWDSYSWWCAYYLWPDHMGTFYNSSETDYVFLEGVLYAISKWAPAGSICKEKTFPTYSYDNITFGSWSLERIEDESIVIQDENKTASIRNGKSFSWSLSGLMNWYNSFSFDSLLVSNQTPVIKISSWSGGINYFEINWEGNFYPLVYVPFENHYKVKICWGWNLLNPQQSNNNNVIWNEWQIYFEIWKKYTLPITYDCLDFEFYMEIIGDITLDKFNVWWKNITWSNTVEICSAVNGDNYVDGEIYEGDISKISDNWDIKIKKVSISNKIWIDWSLEYQESLDKNGDGVISYGEATGGVLGWIYWFIEWIKNTAESIVNFLDSFSDFWNVESKSLLGWLVPSVNANDIGDSTNIIIGELKWKAEEFANEESKSKSFIHLVYWLILTLLFIAMLFVMWKDK